MTIFNDRIFDSLVQHASHDLTVTVYGDGDVVWNIAIECRDCHVVAHDIEPEQDRA